MRLRARRRSVRVHPLMQLQRALSLLHAVARQQRQQSQVGLREQTPWQERQVRREQLLQWQRPPHQGQLSQ